MIWHCVTSPPSYSLYWCHVPKLHGKSLANFTSTAKDATFCFNKWYDIVLLPPSSYSLYWLHIQNRYGQSFKKKFSSTAIDRLLKILHIQNPHGQSLTNFSSTAKDRLLDFKFRIESSPLTIFLLWSIGGNPLLNS